MRLQGHTLLASSCHSIPVRDYSGDSPSRAGTAYHVEVVSWQGFVIQLELCLDAMHDLSEDTELGEASYASSV